MNRARFASCLLVAVSLLANPSAAVVPTELDHLVCYRMRDPLKAQAAFDLLAKLQPEFSRSGCRLVGDDDDSVRSQFCVPASKVRVDADGHNAALGGPPLLSDYVCYRIECPEGVTPPNKFIEDQFGRRAVRFGEPARLCVPARKEPIPCSATGSGSGLQCGGACPDPSQRCRRDRISGACTCEPTECRGRPDAAGMCGGICPDPTQRCVRNVDNRCVCEARGCSVDPTTLVCSGECPVAGEICMIDAAGDCGCAPPPAPCAKDPATGQCGGPCPVAGDVCTTDAAGNCRCLPPPPPQCGPDPLTGQCSGPCPVATDVCTTDASGACRCLPPPPPGCAKDPATGQCGGPCPVAGDVCTTDTTGNCRCLPPPPPQCGLDPLTGQCGGPCPVATEECITRADGTCGCEPPLPCSLDEVTGICGGFCPPGRVCAQEPGTGACLCVAAP